MSKYCLYIFIFLAFFSCTRRVSNSIDTGEVSNIIDLTAGFNNIQTIRLSEIADSVTFIPLETNRHSLIGQSLLYNFSSQYIFHTNKYFDWSGKYYGSIGQQGNGPFEEPEGVWDIVFKNEHFYSKGTKFLEYDITGKPTGKVRNLYRARESSASDFLRSGTEFSSIGENFMIFDLPSQTVYFIDKDFEVISSRSIIQPDSLPYYSQSMYYQKFVTRYKDETLFYNFINDTIFYFTDISMEPRWIVSFDDRLRVPSRFFIFYHIYRNEALNLARNGHSIENTEIVRQADHKHFVSAAYETDSYIFFLMTEYVFWADRGSVSVRNKPPADPYIIYYEKNNGKATRVNGKGFVDDILGMDFFYPEFIYDEKLITPVWPYELHDFIEEQRDRGREISPQLLEFSKKIKPEDNPILILVHLKKK